MGRFRRFYNTLLGRVGISMTLILFFSMILIINIDIRVYTDQKEKTLSFLEMTLEKSSNVFSAQVETMSAFYQSMFANNVNYQQLKKPVSEQAFHLAATQMQQDMDDIFFSYSGLTFTYCYIAERDYLIQSSTHPNYEKSEAIKRFIREQHAMTEGTVFAKSVWRTAEVDQTSYFFNTIRQKNVEFGIIMESSHILEGMHILDELEEGVLYFTDEGGEFVAGIAAEGGRIHPCGEEGIREQEMMHVQCGCDGLPVVLNLLLPRESFLGPLRRQIIMNIAALLATMSALFLLVFYLFYRFTAKPVRDIAAVARGLGSGELDQRLPEEGQIAEITDINRNFNQLIAAITALKIDLYEEKLRRQDAELAQLRLQLNPHFLLNSLNLVYTMTRQQHYEVAMQFCLCLIRHFRFVLRKNHNFVPLSEELDFCENYMEIISLQYPSYFFYEISLADESLPEETLLPPLSVENLIENAVKYGLTQEEALHIRIRIEREERKGLACTLIDIRDDGPGYSEEALAYIRRIQDGTQTHNLASDGVGLKNLIERLRLLYEGNAELSFSNDSGARIRMSIPSTWPQNRGQKDEIQHSDRG